MPQVNDLQHLFICLYYEVNKRSALIAHPSLLRDRKIRCRINELNRCKPACEGYPKAYKSTSRGEVRLELIDLITEEICTHKGRFLHKLKYFIILDTLTQLKVQGQ